MSSRSASLSELRAFIAVADHGGFGRAARHLGVGQPSVSRSVARLESRIGVALIRSGTRGVVLTPSGAVLLRQIRHLPDAIDTAVRLTRRAAHTPDDLRLGVKPDGDAGLLPSILDRAENDERINGSVTVCFGATDQLADRVRRGELDAALLQGPFDATGLECELLLSEPRLLATACGDPLLDVPDLHLRDVDPARLVRWPDASPALQAYYQGRDGATSTVPEDGGAPAAQDLADALRLVELGHAVTVLPRSVTRRYQRDALAYRTVDGLSPAPLAIAWPEHARSLRLAALVDAAQTR